MNLQDKNSLEEIVGRYGVNAILFQLQKSCETWGLKYSKIDCDVAMRWIEKAQAIKEIK